MEPVARDLIAVSAAGSLPAPASVRPWLRERVREIQFAYGIGVLGVIVFGAGGIGDMVWHVAFGVEAGLEALLSPTHLVLLAGGILLLTSPLRAVEAIPEQA